MPTKYLELDSTYRNRNLRDNVGPGSFISEISQTGNGTQISAVDPITYAYPDIVFRYTDTAVTLTYTLPAVNTGFSSQSKFLLTNAGGLAYAVNGYFVGAVLNIPISILSTVQQPAAGTLNYRITEWIQLSNTQFLVSTEIPVPWTDTSPAGGVAILQPSTAITTAGVQYIFLPNSLSIPNYYTGYYIYNQTQNDGYLITSYDKDTHRAQITTTKIWLGTDVLIVRKQLPRSFPGDTLPYEQYAAAPAIPAILAIPNTVTLTINLGGANVPVDASFINNFIRFYTPNTNTAYTVAKIIGIVLQITKAGVTTYVVDYDGEQYYNYNNKGYVSVYTNSVVIDRTQVLPSLCEIMNFSVDSYAPFSYNGGLVSQNQPTSYDVTLNSIVLPNTVLSTGGRIAYYPFVYVEIENLSTSTGSNKNSIYSNNPNAYKAIFKVPITDLNHPATTPFVKLAGNGMTQTITFKTNTDMKLTVRLPDGTIFTPVSADNPPGQRPNPLIQLSALFGLTRV